MNDSYSIVEACEKWLTSKVHVLFINRKLVLRTGPNKSVFATISGILSTASQRNAGSTVAYHLVRATLAHRYKDNPQIRIDNPNTKTADQPLGRDGDFSISDTAFHVTVGPTSLHSDKCAENIQNGLRPILLVPSDEIERAKHLAEDKGLYEKVSIVSIEGFVGQNIEELGEFKKEKVKPQIGAVLKEYNRRIDEAETDKSLQIKIPKNLE